MMEKWTNVDINDEGLWNTLKSVAQPTFVHSVAAGLIALVSAFFWWFGLLLYIPFALYVLFNSVIITFTVLSEIILFMAVRTKAKDSKRLKGYEKLNPLFSLLARNTTVVFLIQLYLLVLTIFVGHFIFSRE
ncbi:MAG: hypothetical protein AB7W44_08140 [Pyrinomonadaceae bacterium]